MKHILAGTFAAGTLAALIAGCGNGGSSPAASTPPPAAPNVLTLSGTAATGLALANAPVVVRCAAGAATATTNATGGYSVDVANATLPCMLQATATVNGAQVVLHSVVEGAAATTGAATVTANVTPLTEMIVAQLAGAQPSSLFESFASAPPAIDAAKLTAATAAVVSALRTATSIDLGTIDPFKAPLVAATPTAPTAGNLYDQLLDQLGAKVPPAALPLVVAQIANAAAAAASAPAGTTPPVTIGEVLSGVAGGAMPNCPQVLSGNYRTMDVYGRTNVRAIDFASLTFKDTAGIVMANITLDPARPCEMTLTATEAGRGTGTPATTSLELKVAMGPQGAGAYQSTRALSDGTSRYSVGYLFPVQSHPYSAITGSWLLLESGYKPEDQNPWEHLLARMDVGAEGAAVVGCDHGLSLDATPCVPWNDVTPTSVVADADGGFRIRDGATPVYTVYAYRAPNGSMTLFGSANVAGNGSPTVQQSTLVAKRAGALAMPALGTVSRFWDLQTGRTPVGPNGREHSAALSLAPTARVLTVSAVDAQAGTFQRTREGDNRVDTVRNNRVVDGVRVRQPDTTVTPNISAALQFPLGAGITPVVNLNQSPSATWFTALSVTRP